jgi:hypothetical protein
MNTLTPIHDEIGNIKSILRDQDIPMTRRERKDMEKRLWDLEWSSWYAEARLSEQRFLDASKSC